MCQPATCPRCSKTTWTGCGLHVDEVMEHVAPADRCPGHDEHGLASTPAGA